MFVLGLLPQRCFGRVTIGAGCAAGKRRETRTARPEPLGQRQSTLDEDQGTYDENPQSAHSRK